VTEENISLQQIKQTFFQQLSIKEPSNTKIPTSELVICLVFHFISQAKDFFSLASVRRNLIEQTDTKISRQTFYDRIATQKLNLILYKLFSHLTSKTLNLPLRGQKLCKNLGVQDIYLFDSSSFTLPSSASDTFPGAFTKAALKFHYCFSILSGFSPYFDYSQGSSHDSNYFPRLLLLKGKLILFDLAYYSYSFFQELKDSSVFFFSRVKEGTSLKLISITSGLPQSCLGMTLNDLQKARYYKQEIDALVQIEQGNVIYQFRVLGFYNKK
jgi:hypothetical protein